MQVSSGRPHILTSNQRGRGNDPVTVLGRIRSAVAVNIGPPTGILLPNGRAQPGRDLAHLHSHGTYRSIGAPNDRFQKATHSRKNVDEAVVRQPAALSIYENA